MTSNLEHEGGNQTRTPNHEETSREESSGSHDQAVESNDHEEGAEESQLREEGAEASQLGEERSETSVQPQEEEQEMAQKGPVLRRSTRLRKDPSSWISVTSTKLPWHGNFPLVSLIDPNGTPELLLLLGFDHLDCESLKHSLLLLHSSRFHPDHLLEFQSPFPPHDQGEVTDWLLQGQENSHVGSSSPHLDPGSS
ncbi:hypothetical protein IGI04_040405 [Brassica rapa subsp. trilocularis]|uniref:Uncharacterized protein n=1 Tax=Brassica rapa subsp. trilocularis TaxID=1813537 RepID=A0ABQ7KR99_BRACM|nr:hypothetical protein IGI04_040405 [Brassica rapa subsp. trilocularis]